LLSNERLATKIQTAMRKRLVIIVFVFLAAIALIAIVGKIKFDIFNDDIYVQQEDGSVVKYNDINN